MFIKYRVRAEQVQEQVRQPASMSAFDVLMRAQRQLCLRLHPETINLDHYSSQPFVHQRVSVLGMTLKSSTHSVKAVPRKARFLM